MKLKFPKQQLVKLLLLVILLTILPVLFISDAYLNQKVIIRRSIKPCNALDPSKRQFRVTLDGITYPNIVPLYHNSSLDLKCLNSSSSVKTILMWNKFKGLPLINFGFGVRQPFEKMNCPVTNCELTNDRSKLSDADLVIFHLRNKIDYFPSTWKNIIHIKRIKKSYLILKKLEKKLINDSSKSLTNRQLTVTCARNTTRCLTSRQAIDQNRTLPLYIGPTRNYIGPKTRIKMKKLTSIRRNRTRTNLQLCRWAIAIHEVNVNNS